MGWFSDRWVARAHHDQVVALYETRVAELKAECVASDKRAADVEHESRRVTERLLSIATPADQPKHATAYAQRAPAERAPLPPLDPTNRQSLMLHARAETGSNNARVVLQKMEQLRAQYNRAGVVVATAPPEPFDDEQEKLARDMINQDELEAREHALRQMA